jgi:hypothetical protein
VGTIQVQKRGWGPLEATAIAASVISLAISWLRDLRAFYAYESACASQDASFLLLIARGI